MQMNHQKKKSNLDVHANPEDGNCALNEDGVNGRIAKAPHILPVVWLILVYLFSSSGISYLCLIANGLFTFAEPA
jgi:hypothetical protein